MTSRKTTANNSFAISELMENVMFSFKINSFTARLLMF